MKEEINQQIEIDKKMEDIKTGAVDIDSKIKEYLS